MDTTLEYRLIKKELVYHTDTHSPTSTSPTSNPTPNIPLLIDTNPHPFVYPLITCTLRFPSLSIPTSPISNPQFLSTH